MTYQKFKIGTVEEIETILDRLNAGRGQKPFPLYRLTPATEQVNLWVIEEETDDYLDCAMVEITEGVVYAISPDVYTVLLQMFGKVL